MAGDGRRVLLELSAVESGYGSLRILKGVTFEVREGEIVTLIGSNGAGKTTVLNTVCGVVPAARGHHPLRRPRHHPRRHQRHRRASASPMCPRGGSSSRT